MYYTSSRRDRELHAESLGTINTSIGVIGITSGCFDVIHPLHIQYLQKCASKCDFLVVGIDSDSLLYSSKNKMPVICEYDRAFIVSSLECVDQTFIMDNLETLDDVLQSAVEGMNNREFIGNVQLYKAAVTYYGHPVITRKGVDTISIPDVYPASSTTELVKYIQNNYQKL